MTIEQAQPWNSCDSHVVGTQVVTITRNDVFMVNSLKPREVRVGHLIEDYSAAYPVQGATLVADDRGGELQVAYLFESTQSDQPPYQFLRTNEWFRLNDEDLPKTLLFVDDRGWITLAGTRVDGASIGTHPLGRIRASAMIFNRPRTIQSEYLIQEFRSTIDCLDEFVRFEPVLIEMLGGDSPVKVTIDPAESVGWSGGGYEYVVHANVAWTGEHGRSFEILDNQPFLQTAREGGATLFSHYRAQVPIRALLTLVFGTAISWRSHKLRDNEFPMWMLDGSERGPHSVEVQLEATVSEHRSPAVSSRATLFPLFRLRDIGAQGMSRWTALYENDDVRRAIEPVVEVFNGATQFLEPQLMMLAISLDRFGYYRFGDGERRAMREHIEICLDEAALNWPEIGSTSGIARAISNLNNDLKHPDRPSYPAVDEMGATVGLARVIARAQLFDLVGADDELRLRFLKSNDVLNAVHAFTERGIGINDDGAFIRRARPE